MRPLPREWNDPPWHAPLDTDAALLAIPDSANMTGMFLSAVQDLARARGVAIDSARERYLPFHRYPLTEHCRLLVSVGRTVFPGMHLREALRRVGRGAPQTLVSSLIGRVVLGAAEGPFSTLRAMARSYTLHMNPCVLEVVETGERSAVVRMADIYNFLDCHNVGVFEGVLRFAGVRGTVKVCAHSPTEADLLCEWS